MRTLLIFIAYQCLQLIMFPAVLLVAAFRTLRGKPFLGNFWQRLGLVPKPSSPNVVWFHAVSVGEVLSIQGVIKRIKKQNPSISCYLTVGTTTGYDMAKTKLSDLDTVSFLPFDFLPCILLCFARIKPSSLVIVEGDFWPNLLMMARIKNIRTSVINARMRKKSFGRYKTFGWFFRALFAGVNRFYTQSEDDSKRFENLGIRSSKLTTIGDIKTINVLDKVKGAKQDISHDSFPVLLAGSIHPGEEDVYLELHRALKSDFPTLRTIIAPRHFHWKENLMAKARNISSNVGIWDQEEQKLDDFTNSNIILVCKLGELFSLYNECDIFFLGGTFVPVGGHNLLEPAGWGKLSIVGPYHANCKSHADELDTHKGLIKVQKLPELLPLTRELLCKPLDLNKMGAAAQKWLEKQALHVEENISQLTNPTKG